MKLNVIFVFGFILSCSCQSSQQLSTGKFSLYEKVKNFISLQITELVDEIAELENSVDDDIVDDRNLPQFSDPLVIGNFDRVPILIANDGLEKIDFSGVEFHGLRSAATAKYKIDNNKKEVILSIPLSKAEVTGNYAAFNSSGIFTFRLLDNVTYTQTTHYSYSQNGGPVRQLQLKTSQAVVQFDNSSVEFESTNIGIFDDSLLRGDRTIGLIIGESVFSKVFEEVDPKMAQNVERVIQNWLNVIVNRFDSGLHNVVNKIHEAIPDNEAIQVELGIQNPEFEYNETKIKISSIKLNGIENFYLNESIVYKVGFYIAADFRFLVPTPNVSVIFTYQDGDFKKQVIGEYAVKHILVDLVLGKDSIGVYGVELQNCVFGVAQVQPYLGQFLGKNNFEEGLIKNSTSQIYPHIAGAIEEFFATEVYHWVSRRAGEPKYFQRLRKTDTNFSDKTQRYYEIEVLAMPIRRKKQFG